MSATQALEHARALHARGRLADAERACRLALEREPDHFDAAHLLAIMRAQIGDYEAARDLLAPMLRSNAKNPAALSNMGLILRKLGRTEEALSWIDKALRHSPRHLEALNNRGNALLELGRCDEAVDAYDEALRANPSYVEALNNRGTALRILKRFEDALASYDLALAIAPNHLGALNNRGVALQDMKRPLEALETYDQALALEPSYVEALVNRGLVLLALNRADAALASFDKALASCPEHVEARYNRGWASLLLGDFETGWEGYEQRWNRAQSPRRLIERFTEWRGETVAGKRILIYEEQGFGDVIQFSRYVLQLASMGADVTFLVSRNLHRLLRSLTPTARLIAEPPGKGESFDYQCALLSLPGAVRTCLHTIPAEVPYLHAEANRIAVWRGRIEERGLKVGICWQGNPVSQNDIERFAPLNCFAALNGVEGVRLISLQKMHGLEQLTDLAARMNVETLGADFDAGPDAFLDTAAVMCCLDLIVTVDTAVAHLAGALGRPVWVAQKFAPDWRWMLDRSDCPWYPTMRLYRQARSGDWSGVFSQMAEDLARFKPPQIAEPLLIPGSLGEFYDRLSILEIKAARMADPAKLRNVLQELSLLRDLAAKPPDAAQTRLLEELKRANEIIWDAEEAIRDCERRQDFGQDFVAHARAVYKNNDRRAAIKKILNLTGKSAITEEKSHADSD